MDQDNTKGQDKRSWRERLGVGAQGNKDLPKISDDFKKEPQPAQRPVVAARPAPRPVAPAPAVRPAPMAPRATPVAPRATPKAPPPSPVPADKLAERLRSQREASTRLAEQRVQVAKQRAEIQAATPIAAPAAPQGNAPRPKFAFAEDGEASKSVAPNPAPMMTPKPQIAPPRMPLGGTAVPPVAPPPARPVQNYAPPPSYVPPQQPAGYQPGYNPQPVPPYRPIDPATGQPATGGYVPPRGFTVPPQQGGFTSGPRLNVPPRMPVAAPPNYGQQPDFAPGGRMAPRPEPRVAPPQQSEYEEEFYDEMPTARGGRPTSTDYKQAYREAEYGYEEEQPRSKAPWILAGFLLFAMLLAGGLTLAYIYYGKPLMGGQLSGQSGTQDVPAVAAPETPAKVAPEQPAAAQQPAAASPTKKQIYDRIVGDQEILGGEVAPPAETPAAIPEPTNAGDGATPAPAGTGEDAVPLPIPPPPGGAGDQQGSLAPDNGKQSSEVITAAAGESQAAVAAQDLPTPPEPDVADNTELPVPPAPGETDKARSILAESKLAEPATAESETEKIVDAAPPPPLKKKVESPAKKAAAKVAEKKLGAKPVVLVPPSKKAKAAAEKQVASAPVADGTDGGLYGDEDITVAPAKPAVEPIAAPKKKKTLADLFNNNEDADAGDVAAPVPAEQKVATIEPPAAAKKPAPSAPPPAAASGGGGGFVVQLASFRSRDEAASEFSRLKSKHSGVLGPYSSIISEAEVGGSTRYRLSAGRMTSQAQANAVCTSLFAKGERDCIVKKQ